MVRSERQASLLTFLFLKTVKIFFFIINVYYVHIVLISLKKGVVLMRMPALPKKKSPTREAPRSWWKVVKAYLSKGKFYRLPPRHK